MIDTTITVGNLIEVVAILGAGLTVLVRVSGNLRDVENDIKNMKETMRLLTKSFEQVTGLLTKIAVQENRMSNFEFRLMELSHGRGWVQSEIGGEYPRPPLPKEPL